jgi:hypothetical protein
MILRNRYFINEKVYYIEDNIIMLCQINSIVPGDEHFQSLKYNVINKKSQEGLSLSESQIYTSPEHAKASIKPKWEVGEYCYYVNEHGRMFKQKILDIHDSNLVLSYMSGCFLRPEKAFKSKADLLKHLEESCNE